MRVEWSNSATLDVARLRDFLWPVAPSAAMTILRQFAASAGRLAIFPRMGERLEGIEGREVRGVIVWDYEMQYEVRPDTIVILRIFHTREER